MESKTCTSCTSSIPKDASRCPHCRARQPGSPPMHRGHPEKMIAGVCAGIAHELSLDVAFVRVAFALAVLLSGGLAAWVYVLLWFFTPASENGTSGFSSLSRWVGDFFNTPVKTSPPRPPSSI